MLCTIYFFLLSITSMIDIDMFLSRKLQTIYMRLFTLFTYLNTKESHDRRITRRVWEFSQQISKAKYPKISQKYRSKISGRFRRTPLHCAERPLSHPGRRLSDDPDMSVRRNWNASSPIRLLNSGCKTSGCKWWRLGANWRQPGTNWLQPGVIPTRICYPDVLRWCIRMPCPIYSLHGFQRTLLHLRFALVIKKLSKHQNLTQFD